MFGNGAGISWADRNFFIRNVETWIMVRVFTDYLEETWYGASSYCTTSYRFFNLLVTRFNIYGFRLASSVKKE